MNATIYKSLFEDVPFEHAVLDFDVLVAAEDHPDVHVPGVRFLLTQEVVHPDPINIFMNNNVDQYLFSSLMTKNCMNDGLR